MCKLCKGITLGVIAGMAAAFAINPVSKRDIRMMKRRATRAIHYVGDVAGDMCSKMG